MSAEENIAVVVLAAGGSSRLGRPKQLVEFNGKPLLDHALDKVDLLGFQTKILVLGAKQALKLKKNCRRLISGASPPRPLNR